jgi:outer membrane protein assembly factor BamB
MAFVRSAGAAGHAASGVRRDPQFRATALALAASLLVMTGCAGAGPHTGSSGSSLARPVFHRPAQPAGHAVWAPWPSALHDARHGGAADGIGPAAGTIRWRRRLEGPVTPGPVVGPDGTIYVASNAGLLHALDPVTGADRWVYDSGQSNLGDDLSVSPLVLPGGAILWPTPGRQLLELSATGEKLWSLTMSGHPTSPASVQGRRVYVGDASGDVTAFDIMNQQVPERVWTVKVGSTSYGSVVVGDGGRLYTTADSSLIAIDDTGVDARIAWRRDPADDISEVSAGLAADGTALLGTNGTQEWAYRPDGTLLWHSPRVITYSSPAVTDSGLAYVADHSGAVHVFRISDGVEVTTYRSSGQIWSAALLDARYDVYFATQSGHVVGQDVNGARLFDLDLGAPIDSYPALTADANLIVGARDGTLIAIS